MIIYASVILGLFIGTLLHAAFIQKNLKEVIELASNHLIFLPLIGRVLGWW